MALAVAKARAIPSLLEREELRERWRVLVGLMKFFLLGYVVTIGVLLWGSYAYLELLTGVVFLFGSAFVYVTVAVGHDSIATLEARVSERTEKLAAAHQAAQEANQAKSEFLASMSHELRTPMNAILGFTELLDDGTFGELNPKQRRYVGHILTNGGHLLELIERILDLSKIEAERLELELVQLDPATLALEVCEALTPLALSNGLRFEHDIPSLPSLWADPTRVRQILYNLLGNALKFTPEGGRVWLEVRHQEGSIVFRVGDTGGGIDPHEQEKIFHRFVQLDGSLTRARGGSGLGLYLVQELVRLHSGTVELQSSGKAGEGCLFTVTLPCGG